MILHGVSRLLAIPKAYKPAHNDDRMYAEGDVVQARADYAQRRSDNLRRLISNRFVWMNQYIGPDDFGADLGCGTGFSREFIRCRKLLLTDFAEHDYLDMRWVDALHLPFTNDSLDFVIASNVIHHLYCPIRFFDEANRVLRRGGVLLIHEVHASVLFCAVLRAMRHEGYSFEVDVFDRDCICTDPKDLWSGNNAVPRLLFDNHEAFLRHQPGWRILRDEFCECLMFLNSGGVTAKTKYIPLPAFALHALELVDRLLVNFGPNFFALGRRIALEKV